MPASSRAPRLLLCLFPILSVLASARDFPVPHTHARGTHLLTVEIRENLKLSSPILAERDDNVCVIVNNYGKASLFIYVNVLQEMLPQDARALLDIHPRLTLMQEGGMDATLTLAGMDFHTVPANQTRKYRFDAPQGTYKCTELKRDNNMTVLIFREKEPQVLPRGIGGLDGLTMARNTDLVTAQNEAPGIQDLFVLTDGGETLADNNNTGINDVCPSSSDILKLYDCKHPTTLANCRDINWASEEHRRPCLASIVNTVYCGNNDVLALERSLKDTGFSLHETLKEGKDIYAAIYKYKSRPHEDEPDFIVAFRGTEWCFEWKTIMDTWLNCQIGVNGVEYTRRFKKAYKRVEDLTNGKHRVWLTGHSQGASLALHIGRQAMLNKDKKIPTFAFNPPLAIVCWFPNFAKKFIGTMTPSSEAQSMILSEWTPVLYVHTGDFIFCRCFIQCLKKPTQVDRWVMKLPSVMLCEHSSEVKGGWLGPHSLDQWLQPDSQLNLNCQAVRSTNGDENLNCQDININEEHYKDDIEAQMNQNPVAPTQDQHAPPARRIAITGIKQVWTIFVGMLAVIVMRKAGSSCRGRTHHHNE